MWWRNDAEAETPVLWPLPAKCWLIEKYSDAGRDWGQEEKGTIEDEMAGWHHWLDGRESEWTPGVGDGQGGVACCDSWGRENSDTTEWLNLTELIKPKSLTVWITTNWEIFQLIGLPDHLTCLLRNLYAGQEVQLELDMEQQTGSKSEKLS